MDDEEEMKNQCFGGEYLGEVFDHMLKRYDLIGPRSLKFTVLS